MKLSPVRSTTARRAAVSSLQPLLGGAEAGAVVSETGADRNRGIARCQQEFKRDIPPASNTLFKKSGQEAGG